MRGSGIDLETLLLRSWALGGGGLLGGVDWLTVVALLVTGALYFLAPVFGYRMSNRGLLVASLWVFIAKMGLALLRVCIVAMEFLDRTKVPTSGGSGSSTNMMEMVLIVMSVFETGLFVLGIVLLVIGLTALRRDMDLPRSPRRDFPDD